MNIRHAQPEEHPQNYTSEVNFTIPKDLGNKNERISRKKKKIIIRTQVLKYLVDHARLIKAVICDISVR